MAKPRQPPPKPTKAQAPAPPADKSVRRVSDATPDPRSAPAAPAAVQRRSTYVEAVALYERGLAALQRHDYNGAADIFESVLRQYPEEKELHERVRLYLNICRRQATPREATPEDRRRAPLRRDALDQRRPLRRGDHASPSRARRGSRQRSRALHARRRARAARRASPKPIAHLERAIALNPENRAVARQDPDLEPLRADDAFRAALDTPSTGRPDRRAPDSDPNRAIIIG